jgi:hypothetical protein
MPPSALDRLASLHIEYPMLFQLSNVSVEKTSHCGVLEFTADEGLVYLPYWVYFFFLFVSFISFLHLILLCFVGITYR